MPGAHHGFAIREARSRYGPVTHTSGYGYDIFNPDIARYVEFLGLPSIMSRKNGSLRVFAVGTGWEYGIGIDLAGKVVESDRPQPRSLFSPAHFRAARHARHELLLSDDMARRLVGTHIRGADGKPAPISLNHRRMATSTQAAPDCAPPPRITSLSLACCWRAARSTACGYSSKRP